VLVQLLKLLGAIARFLSNSPSEAVTDALAAHALAIAATLCCPVSNLSQRCWTHGESEWAVLQTTSKATTRAECNLQQINHDSTSEVDV
jgi:hypothetical protein